MPFQTQVNLYPAEGFPGSQASANTMYAGAVLAGENIPVGRFVSISAAAGLLRAYLGGNAVGIVNRIRSGIITDITAEASTVINKNLPLEITVSGDLYIIVENAGTAERGQKLFYRSADSSEGAGDAGAVQSAASGTSLTGFVETAWSVVSVADSVTGLVRASTVRNS